MRPKLDEKFEKDSKIRATLVLSEFMGKRPIFESFKVLCKKFGNDFMDFIEFEFWFMRFSAGKFDLDYDRSQDPKYCTITDLPIHIFQKILDKLGDDFQKETRWKLRHVSKSFRDIVDAQKLPKIEEIQIGCDGKSINLNFRKYLNVWQDEKSRTAINLSYNSRKLAVDDLVSVLARPDGYKLYKLKIGKKIDNRFFELLCEKLRETSAKIAVEDVDLHWDNEQSIIDFLKLFQSIRAIEIERDDDKKPIDQGWIDKINKINSLKTRSCVVIGREFTAYDPDFLIPRGLDLSEMVLYFNKLGVRKAIQIVQKLLESPRLEYCKLCTGIKGKTTFVKELLKLGAKNHPNKCSSFFKYPIPNSDDFFEICTYGNTDYILDVFIKRISTDSN